jgi:hypothetical protein
MKQTINNGEQGLSVRDKLNGMFTELYTSVSTPIILSSISVNTTQVIPANTNIESLMISVISGTPTVNIGTASGNGDVLITSLLDGINDFEIDSYLATEQTLYINVSGGVISIRINVTTSYL